MPEETNTSPPTDAVVQSIPVPPAPQVIKSSDEILSELFGAFNATPPVLDDIPQDSKSVTSQKSHKKHKPIKTKKKHKREKKKRRSLSSDSKSSSKKKCPRKHKKTSSKTSNSHSESIDAKKKKKTKKLGKFSASDSDSDNCEPKSKKKKTNSDDKITSDLKQVKVKIKQEKEDVPRVKEELNHISTVPECITQSIIKDAVSKIVEKVFDSTKIATEICKSIAKETNETLKSKSGGTENVEIVPKPIRIKQEPENKKIADQKTHNENEIRPNNILKGDVKNEDSSTKRLPVPVADVFAEDLIDSGIRDNDIKNISLPDKPKQTGGKIKIQNLKFSQVYEATVKQIEEEAKLKAEKYEEGELSDSSEEPERSPSPLSSSETIEKELEECAAKKKKRKHHHKKEKRRHHGKCRNKKRSKSREKHRSHLHRERSLSNSRHREPNSRDRSSSRSRLREEWNRDILHSQNRIREGRSRSRSRSPQKERRSRERSHSSSSLKRRRSRDRSKDRAEDKKRSRGRSEERRRTKESQTSKERSRSREKQRPERSGRQHSRDRAKRNSEDKIDKQKLLEIARKNAMNMMKNPSGTAEQAKVTITSGGKTVNELTDFCKQLSKKDADGHESISSNTSHSSDSESEKPFHHPFQIKDRPSSIVLNIRNSVALPVKSLQEKTAEQSRQLRLQFPVSSGQHHRKTESEWIPVTPKKAETTLAPANCQVAVIKPTAKTSRVFKDAPNPPTMDIGSIVSQRLRAMRKLQENPTDEEALTQMFAAQQNMQNWAESKQLPPGQFSGTTGVKVLSQAELASGFQAWARRDQLQVAAPVNSGMGMTLLQKMGWRPGEGLGKNKEGTLQPLLLQVKMDKKGLVAQEELPVRQPHQVIRGPPRNLEGEHPVSLLYELCSRRKYGPPFFELIDEMGPDHKKNFLFKVRVNGVEYKPAVGSPKKKQARAEAAEVCLKALSILPNK